MPRARALDAGCGTGFQTAILDEMGYAVHGLDLSRELLRGARERLLRAPLVQGDVQTLPYRDGGFDAATCCGSTLSYVDDARQALAEIARVLRPGGRLLIECEGRWSLDLAWAWLSGLLGDPLDYELTPGEVWRAATTPRDRECRLRYPGYGTLRLFSAAELARLLRAAGSSPSASGAFTRSPTCCRPRCCTGPISAGGSRRYTEPCAAPTGRWPRGGRRRGSPTASSCSRAKSGLTPRVVDDLEALPPSIRTAAGARVAGWRLDSDGGRRTQGLICGGTAPSTARSTYSKVRLALPAIGRRLAAEPFSSLWPSRLACLTRPVGRA